MAGVVHGKSFSGWAGFAALFDHLRFVNGIDASALESLELIMHRLEDAGIKLHLSEVKGPVMDRLARSDFVRHLSGQVFLSHHEALAELAPDATREADAARRPPIDAAQSFPERAARRPG